MKRRYKASGLAEFKEEREKKKAIEEVKNETPNELAKSTETIEEKTASNSPTRLQMADKRACQTPDGYGEC